LTGSGLSTNSRQVESLRHAGDLHPGRDAADPRETDHDDIDRTLLDHVPEGLPSRGSSQRADRAIKKAVHEPASPNPTSSPASTNASKVEWIMLFHPEKSRWIWVSGVVEAA
jgi:hypothetical protein